MYNKNPELTLFMDQVSRMRQMPRNPQQSEKLCAYSHFGGLLGPISWALWVPHITEPSDKSLGDDQNYVLQ